ncbi:hypothetical protein D3C87_1488890 [compost metagenome]
MQCQGLRHLTLIDRKCRVAGHIQPVVAGLTIGIGDIEPQLRDIAGREELRCTGRHHHGISNDGIGDRMSHASLRPGDSHDAGRAVELRNIEAHRRLAVCVKFDRSREEGHELFGGRAALQCCAPAITARSQATGGAKRAVDQAAIEVADFQPQPSLTEIPFIRLRRFIAGEVQYADIHSRDDDIGLFAHARAGDTDRNFKRLTRQRLLRRA